MDDPPTSTEFEVRDDHDPPVMSAEKIGELAERFQVTLDPDLAAKENQQRIFASWVQNEAKRSEIVQALRDIDENEIADNYVKSIHSYEKCIKDYPLYFKNVQEEDVTMETCVLQCMPLGPPRTGKTCLKKRLMQESLPNQLANVLSLSTPVVEERQSILTPSMLTLKAERTQWKHISIESELLHLIRKFKNSPHSSIFFALISLDKHREHFLQLALSVSFILYLIYTRAAVKSSDLLLMSVFVFFSFISAIVSYGEKRVSSWRSLTCVSRCIFVIQLVSFVLLYYEKVLIYMKHWIFLLVLDIIARVTSRCFVTRFIRVSCLVFYILIRTMFSVWLLSLSNQLEDELFFSGVFMLLTSPLLHSLQILGKAFYEIGYLINLVIAILFQPIFCYCSGISTFVIFLKTILTIYAICNTYKVYMTWIWFVVCLFTLLILYCNQCITWLTISMDLYTASILLTADVQKRTASPRWRHTYDETSESIVNAARKKINFFATNESTTEAEGLKIYFTDSGGQPEFQEVLPALLSGPTVFFLVFNLSKGLEAKYHVEYVNKSHTFFKPYKTQFTVMDALLQCLATISCIGDFSKTHSQKNIGIRPKVFFVGTHKDLVSADVVLKMEEQLKVAVKKTSWYRKDVIQYASNESLIFSVDNFDSTDLLFSQVRQTIEKLAQSSTYKIQLPAAWLGLELELRKLKESVISISKCKEIAFKCSFSTGENLNEVLWFLHNRLGSIRHYQQIPELRDVVITKPQMLFTIVTDLLVGTFPLAGKARAKFREKGCFTRDELNQVGNLHKTGLSVTQVIALLCHLHILAPLRIGSGVPEYNYFLPCALSHAPKPDKDQLQSKRIALSAPPLLIGFMCGYTPKGVFSGLISYMLQHTHSGLKWSLDEDCIFRDQATFIIDTTGYCLTLKYLPKYLHLELCGPKRSKSSIGNKDIYKKVLTSINIGLNAVQQRLNYTCDTDPSFGFYCEHDSCINDDLHPAFLFENMNGILTCSKHSSNTLHCTDEHQKWFPTTFTGMSLKIFLMIKNAVRASYSILTKLVTSMPTKNPLLNILIFIAVPLLIILMPQFRIDHIDELKSDFNHVANVQRNYYHSICQKKAAGRLFTISCELKSKFQSLRQHTSIKPMWAPYYFNSDFPLPDITQNCAFVVSASFDICHPKPCQDPMREIQNGFIRYLESCSLDYTKKKICWPILYQLTKAGVTTSPIDLYYTKVTFDFIQQLFEALSYAVKYVFRQRSCTKDIVNTIDSKGIMIEDVLAIMKFIAYSRPELAPMLILKDIDEAISTNNSANKAIGDILYHINRQSSSARWLVPIIATTKNLSLFNGTKINGTLLTEYFPEQITL